MKTTLFKALAQGVISAFFLFVLNEYVVSFLFDIDDWYKLVLAGAVFSSLLYFLFIFKERENKKLFMFTALSFGAFLQTFAVLLAMCIVLPVPTFYMRETGNADGLILIFTIFGYCMLSVVLKGIALISLIAVSFSAKRKQRKGEQV